MFSTESCEEAKKPEQFQALGLEPWPLRYRCNAQTN